MDARVNPNKLFWAGLGIYLVSFVLPAVDGQAIHSGPALGYHCAFFSLLVALDFIRFLQGSPGLFGPGVSLVLFGSGMINIVFITLMAFVSWKPVPRARVIVLKLLVIAMLPLCWVFFFAERDQIHPILGYFAWTCGILLVLYGLRPRLPKSEVR